MASHRYQVLSAAVAVASSTYAIILTTVALVSAAAYASSSTGSSGINRNYTHVSFYGDGYLRLPAQDARSDTELVIEFRTVQSNSLIFLAAGTTDYCLVTLHSGSIRARIDLGSGDAMLSTPPGMVFNDFNWHSIRLTRRQLAVTLTVDGIVSVSANTPGQFYELNIDRHIFVGGTGSVTEVYFGNYNDYRGCMRVVQFNGLDVISSARALQSQIALAVYGVEWICSTSEFSAASDRAISFVTNSSYVAFPSLGPRRDVRLTFDIRSPGQTGIVLFNSGSHAESDFLAVEINDGLVILKVNKGAGVTTIRSMSRIDDGQWHQVEVVIDAVTIRLTVDGVRREERTGYSSRARLLDVDVSTSRLYVGGVSMTHRAAALAARLDSIQQQTSGHTVVGSTGSLYAGCIQNFKIDGRLMGLREALVTRSIQPDCVSPGSCNSQQAIAGGGGDDVTRCDGESSDQMHPRQPAADGEHARLPTAIDELVRVRDLVVREGSSSPLSEANIDLASDILRAAAATASTNASRSAAGATTMPVFRVVRPPEHGELFLTGTAVASGSVTAAAATFTLNDVRAGRVVYVHDGSETTVDSLGLEFDLTSLADVGGSGMGLMEGRRKHRFSVVIQIASWNDKPSMTLPADDTLSVIAGTEIQLTRDLFNATDTDDPANMIEWTVQYQPSVDYGYFETVDSMGVRRARVTRFTQADIDAGKVKFVHRGAIIQQLKLQVSDGKDVGETRILKVIATPLRVVYIANNGLVVARGSAGVITSNNLTFQTNAATYQQIEVNYRVIEPPFDGEIQRRQYTDDVWAVTSEFTQTHVNAGRVRYAHLGESRSRGDYFRFRVSALGGLQGSAAEEHEFHVRVVDARVETIRVGALQFGGSRDSAVITSDLLKSTSTIPTHGPSDVLYRLVTIPRMGNLLRADETTAAPATSGRIQRRKLVPGSVFTQNDINEGRVIYRLTKLPDTTLQDSFDFRVSATGIPESSSGQASTFQISYQPEAEDQIRVVNNGLIDVIEGQSMPIGPDDLWVERRGFSRVEYTILESPEHGVLEVLSPSTGSRQSTVRSNVTSFTSSELRDMRVRYQHDDSESANDYFRFSATLFDSSTTATSSGSSVTSDSGNQVAGTFEIKIVLRNDNPPLRLVDRPLYVIDGRGRVVTLDDIAFTDPDTDFDSSLLDYEWRDVTNGHVVHTENHAVPVHKFSQRDIADGVVYFRHRAGSGNAATTLWVTDGQLFTTGLLSVIASPEAFVRATNGSRVTVEYGRRVALNPRHFNVVSNVDAADRDFLFVIIVPPSRGTIRRSGLDRHRFTLADLRAGVVTYEHHASVANRTVATASLSGTAGDVTADEFRFSVHVGDAHADGEVSIQITGIPGLGTGRSATDGETATSQQQQPSQPRKQQKLRVINNTGATIDAFDTIALSAEMLNVTCGQGWRPIDVLYTVTVTPRYGSLSLGGSAIQRDMSSELRTFSQNDVINGRVTYEHQEDGRYVDYFRFDVRCADETSRGLDFSFDILPLTIPVEIVRNITVRHGSSVALSKDVFRLTRRQFEVAELEFLIVCPPSYGKIQSTSSTPLSQFTLQSLRSESILYSHVPAGQSSKVKGMDSFVVLLKLTSRDKQSQPRTVFVNILPVNVHRPLLINNKVLTLTTGSTVPITRNNLLVEDNDTNSENIVYTLLSKPAYGDVTVHGKSVSNFTQAEIDNMKVFFSHGGDERVSVRFDVTDGHHVLLQLTFLIETEHPVLQMAACGPIKAFPGIDQPITKSVLNAIVVNDANQSSAIIYTVRYPPTNGRLRLKTPDPDTLAHHVTSFNQAELEAGEIVYQPTVTSLLTSEAVIADRIVFDVSMVYAEPLRNVTLPVELSYNSLNAENLQSLVTVRPLMVEEGNTVTISKSYLDSTVLKRKLSDGIHGSTFDVIYVITNPPQHGRLAVAGGINATAGYNLTQRQINSNDVIYHHDGSEHLDDCVKLVLEVVEIRPNSTTERRWNLSHVVVLNVTVTPIDDQPFMLKTYAPSVTVLQGESVVIEQEMLCTVDNDTTPDKLVYEISTPATNGRLVNSEVGLNVTIDRFTQQDVNNRHIVFIQDGSRETGAFYFKVSDGGPKGLSKVFSINVEVLRLDASVVGGITLHQGDMSAQINESVIAVDTNGRREKVFYNITKFPMYGVIYGNGQTLQRFSQADLDADSISYIQTDLSSTVDDFELVVYDLQNIITGLKVNVMVKPRLLTPDRPITINSSSVTPTVIGLQYLDASQLQAITGSDPVYYVTKMPTKGRLEKRSLTQGMTSRRARQSTSSRARGPKPTGAGKVVPDSSSKKRKKGDGKMRPSYTDESKLNFTHNDVLKELIVYHSAVPPIGTDQVLNDEFTFVLTAQNSQPVTSKLEFAIISPQLSSPTPHQHPLLVSTSGPQAANSPGDDVADGSVGNNHVMIVIVVAVLTVVVIVVIIVIKCWRRNRAAKRRKCELAAVVDTAGTQPISVATSPQTQQQQTGQVPEQASPLATVNSTGGRPLPPPRQQTLPYPVPIIVEPPSGSAAAAAANDDATMHTLPAATAAVPVSHCPPVTGVHSDPAPRYPQHHSLSRPAGPPTLPGAYSQLEHNGTLGSGVRGRNGPATAGAGPGWKDQVTFDWKHVDPELLQHCRTTNPILHKNQYWV